MKRRQFLSLAPAAGLAALPAGIAPAAGHGGAPALHEAQRRSVGDITVTALSDGGISLGHAPLQGISEEDYAAILRAGFHDPAGYTSGVNAFLVETGALKVLVDAGTGGFFGPEVDNLPANLAATGVAPGDITHVFATHLHPDHVGGALRDGAAVFPGAELVVHEADRAFWGDEGRFADGPEMMQAFAGLSQAVLAAYGDRLRVFDAETEIAPGLTALPLPGHTPGHSGLMIASGNDALLIWADIVHVAPVQLARPEVTIGFDVDPAQAAASRAAILDRVAAERLLVAGSHIPFPGLVHIAADGSGYRAVPAAFDYAAN
jgi:glyoxylase-like metal-dependent hydrolase (beta-lactamase superfamily II)